MTTSTKLDLSENNIQYIVCKNNRVRIKVFSLLLKYAQKEISYDYIAQYGNIPNYMLDKYLSELNNAPLLKGLINLNCDKGTFTFSTNLSGCTPAALALMCAGIDFSPPTNTGKTVDPSILQSISVIKHKLVDLADMNTYIDETALRNNLLLPKIRSGLDKKNITPEQILTVLQKISEVNPIYVEYFPEVNIYRLHDTLANLLYDVPTVGQKQKDILLQDPIEAAAEFASKMEKLNKYTFVMDEVGYDNAIQLFNDLAVFAGQVVDTATLRKHFNIDQAMVDSNAQSNMLSSQMRPYHTRCDACKLPFIKRGDVDKSRQYTIPSNLMEYKELFGHSRYYELVDFEYVPRGTTKVTRKTLQHTDAVIRSLYIGLRENYVGKPIITNLTYTVKLVNKYYPKLSRYVVSRILDNIDQVLGGKGVIAKKLAYKKTKLVKVFPEIFDLDMSEHNVIDSLLSNDKEARDVPQPTSIITNTVDIFSAIQQVPPTVPQSCSLKESLFCTTSQDIMITTDPSIKTDETLIDHASEVVPKTSAVRIFMKYPGSKLTHNSDGTYTVTLLLSTAAVDTLANIMDNYPEAKVSRESDKFKISLTSSNK